MENIKINLTAAPKTKPASEGLPFGKFFTDHMFMMEYDKDMGWHNPRIVPYGPITLDPSAMVFHYAQEIFEGLKAYRSTKGDVLLFRPVENIRRMNESAKRLCIPEIPEDVFMDALNSLITTEKDWVPSEPGTSLYIRPFVIATDPYVGVRMSNTYIFSIITCPVGSYYATGLAPTKILVEDTDVRTVRGGTGTAKCGGNYAASLRAGEKATNEGYSQVLWLDGVEQKYIEEVGSMNVMFKIGGKIITPRLNGSVLPGITRKSCIELLKEMGYDVQERSISVDELASAARDGSLEEAWGTGTAAVVSPIGEFSYRGNQYIVGGNQIGQVTQKLYDQLVGIQWGAIEDTHGWSVKVC